MRRPAEVVISTECLCYCFRCTVQNDYALGANLAETGLCPHLSCGSRFAANGGRPCSNHKTNDKGMLQTKCVVSCVIDVGENACCAHTTHAALTSNEEKKQAKACVRLIVACACFERSMPRMTMKGQSAVDEKETKSAKRD
eukprot:194499-Pleurochrysis_carterae.AAC.3